MKENRSVACQTTDLKNRRTWHEGVDRQTRCPVRRLISDRSKLPGADDRLKVHSLTIDPNGSLRCHDHLLALQKEFVDAD